MKRPMTDDWFDSPEMQQAAWAGIADNQIARANAEGRVALERAIGMLMIVSPHEGKTEILAEVARRTALMGETNAHMSVYDDIVAGRWQR